MKALIKRSERYLCSWGTGRTLALGTAALAAALSVSALLSPSSKAAACEPSYYPSLLAVGLHGTVYLEERVGFRGGDGCVDRPTTSGDVIVKRTRNGATSVIAGETAKQGQPIPGRASASPLYEAKAGTVDSHGNLYVLDDEAVLKITPSGHLSVFAGELGKSGRPTPGKAAHSLFHVPTAIAVDGSDNLYIADDYNDVVEKVTPQGQLSILAGKTRRDSPPIPGPASQSTLGNPSALAISQAGDVYVVSGAGGEEVGRYVSEISPQGTLSVVAGDGSGAIPKQGIPAVDSPLDSVWYMALDKSTLYLVTTKDPFSSAVSVLELNASGTFTKVPGSVYGHGKLAGLPAACGVPEGGYSHWSILPLQFDSAGNVFMDSDANSVHGCVIEVTHQGKMSVLAHTYTQ